MKRNFDFVITDLDGKPVEMDGRPLKASSVVINSLLSGMSGDDNDSGETKLRRWKLAQRIHSNPGEVEVSAEEISDIKARVAKMWSAAVVGPVLEALEK